MRVKITDSDALVIVDMQKDFMPGGSLPVADADKIVKRINEYIRIFEETGRPLFFTRDWHPATHLSFEKNGGIWPDHCVQGTEGAEFCENLYLPADNKFIISKGFSQDFDAYSGFQGTDLCNLLNERGIKRLFISGVATEYCVKQTLFGAENLGFRTILLHDAIKGVDIKKDDSQIALDEMMKAGAILCTLEDIESG